MKKQPTQISRISTKYQTVIPTSIRKAVDLSINQEIFWQIIQNGPNPIIMVIPKPKNWSNYLSGLGKEVWKDVNTDNYLHNLRKEWNQ